MKFLLASIVTGMLTFAAATATLALTITPIDGQPVGAAAYVGIAQDFGNSRGSCDLCTPPTASFVSDPGGITRPPELLFPDAYDNNQTSASATNSFTLNGGSGQGAASADLGTGILKVLAQSSGNIFDPGRQALVPLLTTVSQAGFGDTITPLTTGTMTFTIALDGTLMVGNSDSVGATVSYQFSVTPGLPLHPGLQGESSELTLDTPGCTGSGASLACTLVNTVNVQAGVPMTVVLVLQAFAADGTSDFSHTLALDVTGVPFTSSSGVFLTEQGESTVPEPSSLRLVALGMAAVAVSRRHRVKRA